MTNKAVVSAYSLFSPRFFFEIMIGTRLKTIVIIARTTNSIDNTSDVIENPSGKYSTTVIIPIKATAKNMFHKLCLCEYFISFPFSQ